MLQLGQQVLAVIAVNKQHVKQFHVGFRALVHGKLIHALLCLHAYFAPILVLEPVAKLPVHHPYKAVWFHGALNAYKPGVFKKLVGNLGIVDA